MKPLLSVIMPIYNMENYLEGSVKCVLNQTLENLELILVDDGSSDASPGLCDAFAAADTRVHVVHKPRGGVSSARNAGLSAAAGEYIGFVDPDDRIKKDFYQQLYTIAASQGCDLVSSLYCSIPEEDPSRQIPDNLWVEEVDKKLEQPEIGNIILPAMYKGFDCPVWNKLFKRNLIREHQIRFDENLSIGEDYLFALHYLVYAKSYYYTTWTGYHYTIRKASAVRTYRKNYMRNFSYLYREKKRLLKKYPHSSQLLTHSNLQWMHMICTDFLAATSGRTEPLLLQMRRQTKVELLSVKIKLKLLSLGIR